MWLKRAMARGQVQSFSPKKDGGLRAVADLRKVNACVVADSYTMPDTHDLLDQLAGATWFTSLDLSSAF